MSNRTVFRHGDRVYVRRAGSWGTVEQIIGLQVKVFLDSSAGWEWFHATDVKFDNNKGA